MITLDDIRKKALRIYPQFLKSTLLSEPFFPYGLRSDKNLSSDFVQMSKEISALISGSKDRQGIGYHVSSRTVNTRNHGLQDIPESISFEQQDDYLKFIGKAKEFIHFLENVQVVRDRIPQLDAWMHSNPLTVVSNNGKWVDLLKVCDWFINHFEPNKYYIRELPIAVHTKFIEDNKAVIGELLDHLIPEKICKAEVEFEKRYNLKYIQPLVRFRSLECTNGSTFYDDMSVPQSEFIKTSLQCTRLFIIENKMNFLTFPQVAASFAIWGKGFAIETLKNASWLTSKEIFYWSDLDIQGFQMLSQSRCYFPQTKSLLMEGELLDLLLEFVVEGRPGTISSLANLNEDENAVFLRLKRQNMRLEQERIPQSRVIEEVKKLSERP